MFYEGWVGLSGFTEVAEGNQAETSHFGAQLPIMYTLQRKFMGEST